MEGWIKLHRSLCDKCIWTESTPEQKTVLITLLMMANHQESEWEWKGEKYKISPGQFITSLESIAKKAGKGISIQNVRTSLKRFEKHEFLTSKPTNKNRLITIVNWEVYQSLEDKLTSNLTSIQQATNKQLTTNKNVRMKECKNNTKNTCVYSDDFETFWRVYPRKVEKKKAWKAWEKILKEEKGVSAADLIRTAKGYAGKVFREKTEKRFVKHPSTFLGRYRPYEDYLATSAENADGVKGDAVDESGNGKFTGQYAEHAKLAEEFQRGLCV